MTIASVALRQNIDVIMKRFEERARKEVSSAFGTTSLSLRDALPKHLEQLIAALAAADKKSTEEIAENTVSKEDIGKQHGNDRATSPGYSMEELIMEYRILRQVIIQTLEGLVDLTTTEREIITDLTEQAVNDAAVEFAKVQKKVSEEFTATLSHDLRTPMTAAKMSAQIIFRDPAISEVSRKNAARIINGLGRMDSMIQDLLDSERVKAGQLLHVKFSDCEPAAIAKEVIEQMMVIHGDRFVLSVDGNIQACWNSDLYRRALENLIGNAVKYGDAIAKVTVAIRREKDAVVTIIHNEGKPIPKTEQSTLFERFKRSNSTQKNEKRGWGIGLTLVLGAVQAHGGTVSVESSEGKGTSFIMS
ncbi:MAG: sensor histidine kinase, partial [Bdellovibrionota bacterium]